MAAGDGFGLAHLEWNMPITPATVFPVASLSKLFTALAIALLAEQGRLSLDNDVRRYLPELPDYGAVITLRHLLQHTSGLRDVWYLGGFAGWRPDDLVTDRDILNLAVRRKPSTPRRAKSTPTTTPAIRWRGSSSSAFRASRCALSPKPTYLTRSAWGRRTSTTTSGRS